MNNIVINSSTHVATTALSLMQTTTTTMNFWFNPLSLSLLNSFIGLMLAAVFGALIAFRQYKIQRNQEHIERKYLEGGLEQLIAYLNQMRREVENSFVRAINTLQRMRDLEQEDFIKWFLSQKDLHQNKLSASMPDSLLTTTSFLKDEGFGYICVKMMAVSDSLNQFFTVDVPRLISHDLKNETGIFEIKKAGNLTHWKAIVDKIQAELTRRDREIRPIYKLIETLEEILTRLRILEPNSYKDFFKKSETDITIKDACRKFTVAIVDEINIYLQSLEDYVGILEAKSDPEIKRYGENVLAAITARAMKIASEPNPSLAEVKLVDEELYQQISYLRSRLNGII